MILHRSTKLVGTALQEQICTVFREIETQQHGSNSMGSCIFKHRLVEDSPFFTSCSSTSIDTSPCALPRRNCPSIRLPLNELKLDSEGNDATGEEEEVTVKCTSSTSASQQTCLQADSVFPEPEDGGCLWRPQLSVEWVSPLNCNIANNFTVLCLHGPSMSTLNSWFPKQGIYEVMRIKSLQKLTITGFTESLSKLPRSLGALVHLRHLDVSHNCLASLPVEIGYLRRLKVLNVSFNRLAVIPWSMKYCENLQVFNLSHNAFVKLPQFLNHLPKLQRIQRLGNLFQHWYQRVLSETAVTIVHNQQLHVNSLEQTHRRIFPSLKKLSMLSVLATGIPFTAPDNLPPRLLKETLRVARKAHFCDVCNTPLRIRTSAENAACFTIAVFPKFIKNNFVPVNYQFCSETCQHTQETRLAKLVFSTNPLAGGHTSLDGTHRSRARQEDGEPQRTNRGPRRRYHPSILCCIGRS